MYPKTKHDVIQIETLAEYCFKDKFLHMHLYEL